MDSSSSSFRHLDILHLLEDLVKKEKLYDVKNPATILCSTELARALGTSSFHIKDLSSIILSRSHEYDKRLVMSCGLSTLHPRDQPDALFSGKPLFLKFLQDTSEDFTREAFLHSEVMNLFMSYLSAHNKTLSVSYSSDVCKCNAVLRNIFRLEFFYKCQIPDLISAQLIPFPDFCLDKTLDIDTIMRKYLKSS